MFITILLIIIAIILLGILITCRSLYRSTQKHLEWSVMIYNELLDRRQLLQAGRVSDTAKNIERIYLAIADIKFQQENLEKHEINKAMKTLESIEDSVTELKYVHDTLSSLESSLEIITSHPAFTKHDDDSL